MTMDGIPSFVSELDNILTETAPDFDFKSAAKIGRENGILNHAEADIFGLRGEMPDALRSAFYKHIGYSDPGEAAFKQSELLPNSPHKLKAPVGAHVKGELLDKFVPANAKARAMVRTDGGPSRHYVQNFRKVVWSDEGIFPTLSDLNGEALTHYLKDCEPKKLSGHTLMGVVEGSSIYTHWLLDTLPRLLVLAEQGVSWSEFDNFVFATTHQQFHKATLDDLGIPGEKIVTRQRDGGLFEVDSFTHVSEPRTNFVTHDHVYEMVGDYFGVNEAPKGRTRRYFISRSKAARRRILNEDEVMRQLSPLGYEALCLEDYSIRETAELLAQASHVIAPHGAGMANLVFSRSGTKVIELFNAHLSREYWIICGQKGHEYHAFECLAPDADYLSSEDRLAMTFVERNGCDLIVPVKQLMDYIKTHFGQ